MFFPRVSLKRRASPPFSLFYALIQLHVRKCVYTPLWLIWTSVVSLFFFSFLLSTYTIILGIYFTFKRYITRTIRTVTSLPFCLDSPPLPYPPFCLYVSLTLYISRVSSLPSSLYCSPESRFEFCFSFLLYCSGTSATRIADANVKKTGVLRGAHAYANGRAWLFIRK